MSKEWGILYHHGGILLTLPSAVYSAQNRVALVIGNGSYKSF